MLAATGRPELWLLRNVTGPDGALASDVMVPLESSVQSMIHDCAITPGFTLLLDLPMTVYHRHHSTIEPRVIPLMTSRLCAAISLMTLSLPTGRIPLTTALPMLLCPGPAQAHALRQVSGRV